MCPKSIQHAIHKYLRPFPYPTHSCSCRCVSLHWPTMQNVTIGIVPPLGSHAADVCLPPPAHSLSLSLTLSAGVVSDSLFFAALLQVAQVGLSLVGVAFPLTSSSWVSCSGRMPTTHAQAWMCTDFGTPYIKVASVVWAEWLAHKFGLVICVLFKRVS